MSGAFESLSGAKGLRAQGANQQIIEEQKAKVAEAEGEAALARSGFDQMQQAKGAERIKSSLAAKIGAAGGTGTPVALDLTKEQAAELELENLLIGFEGTTTQARLKSQAQLDRLQGQQAKLSGKAAARRANVQFGLQLASIGTTAAVASDRRVKENIKPMANALDKVKQLKGYSYNYTFNEEDNKNGGVIAQELERVMPEAVSEQQGVKFVRYDAVVALLVEAVNELAEIIQSKD